MIGGSGRRVALVVVALVGAACASPVLTNPPSATAEFATPPPAPSISPPAIVEASAPTPTSLATIVPTPGATLPPLSISNNTALAVTFLVNGQQVATVAPGVLIDPVAAVVLPPLPWAVEARSPSGRVLVSMTVHAGDVRIGSSSAQGDGARIDLSCGRLDIWAGPPMIGPPPGPGTPGDCAP
jgi:hypothetical protein